MCPAQERRRRAPPGLIETFSIQSVVPPPVVTENDFKNALFDPQNEMASVGRKRSRARAEPPYCRVCVYAAKMSSTVYAPEKTIQRSATEQESFTLTKNLLR